MSTLEILRRRARHWLPVGAALLQAAAHATPPGEATSGALSVRAPDGTAAAKGSSTSGRASASDPSATVAWAETPPAASASVDAPASSAASAEAGTAASLASSVSGHAVPSPAASASGHVRASIAASAAAGTAAASAAPPASVSAAPPVGASAAAAPGTAVVRQPRDFGHVIGDVLTQRVLLQDGGRPLRPLALPPADRVGPWLERRAPRLETDDEGRRWLAIDYQFVNAPRALATTPLPALAIRTALGEAPRRSGADVAADGPTLAVPSWPVSVGPLTPAAASLDPAALRPDAPVQLPSTAALRLRLGASAATLAAILAAWLGWWSWRERREAVRLPFARAERELRRLEPASAAAWQALHRAVNASAGRVVPAGGLARWLDERPELRPLQPRLEEFFRRSSRRFFDPAVAGGDEGFDLLALCRALRRTERRHAR